MSNVIDFLKKKYKILIPVMVVLVLLIAVYFLYREYRYDTYRNKKEVEVVQYFGGIKTEYTAVVTYNLKNVIIDVYGLDRNVEYDSTPIYYKEEDKVIFPNMMGIVFPLDDVSQFKLYKYALYENKDGTHEITNGNVTKSYNHFFLYDGDGLYFFPEEVTIKIDGKDYTKLGAGSYISLYGGYTATYYDKANDEVKRLEIEGKTLTAVSDKMEINLNLGYCVLFGKKVLLANPYDLNSITN